MLAVFTLLITVVLILLSYHFQTRHMLRHYKQYKTVSHMYKEAAFRKSFSVGLVATGILQIAYAASLSFAPTFSSIDFGKIVFMIGALGAILLGVFSLADNFVVHEIASFQYFFGLAIGAVLITMQAGIPVSAQFVSFTIVGLWVFTIFWELPRKNGVFAIETVHVLLSYAWIVLIAGTQLYLSL